MSKLLLNRADIGSILIDVDLKPIQEIEINNYKLLFTLKSFYYDSEQLKTRYIMADNNLYYIYILYNNVLLPGGTCKRKKESIDETVEMFKSISDFNERAEKLLKDAQDLTLLTEEELKQFIGSLKEKYQIKLDNKRKEREERKKLKEQERERKWQQYINEKIQFFINNRYITGEVLLTILREINYKIPLRTAGSLRALHSVRITESGGISCCIDEGRKLTDNMRSIIRDVYKILKDKHTSSSSIMYN